jgi:two-component system nitrogen regulation sensor histidine kinase GlnL
MLQKRKRAQHMNELFENIVESLGEGVIAVDETFKIIAFNQSAELITGFPSSLTLHKSFHDVFKKNRWFSELIEKAAKKNLTLYDSERTLTKKNSLTIPVGITVSPLISQEGVTSGAVVIIKDYSDLAPLRDGLLRSDRLAFIGTFAAGISHEVKNPLGGIRVAMQMLSKKLHDKNLLEYTNLVIKEVDRINNILEEILTFSKPRKTEFKPLNLHKVINHVLFLQGEIARQMGVRFIKVYDPSIPPIMGDEEELIQVFLNLVKNCIEAMENSGDYKQVDEKKITLTTKVLPNFSFVEPKNKRDKPKKMVAIDIEDQGVGIMKDELHKIFTPFYSSKGEGSGLGLSLAQKIIKEHHGLIEIMSEPGKGTKVSVLLPLAC